MGKAAPHVELFKTWPHKIQYWAHQGEVKLDEATIFSFTRYIYIIEHDLRDFFGEAILFLPILHKTA
jgi:hypothetical protein